MITLASSSSEVLLIFLGASQVLMIKHNRKTGGREKHSSAKPSMSTTGIPQGFGSGLGPGLGKASAAEAEKDANTTVQKPRSCVVCRRRKVRCDKTSPCSNCRRANIPCLVPSSTADRPPRWARRLELADNDDDKPAIERLAALEALVRDLKAQLAQHKDVDRLPVSDANASTPSRYVSSGFWSTINVSIASLR